MTELDVKRVTHSSILVASYETQEMSMVNMNRVDVTV